jgi:type VI secretion system protein ImpG
VEVRGLDTGGMGAAEEWVLRIPFRRPAGESPRVSADNLRLFCSPVVNLFPHEADPIRVEHDRVAYRIRPEGKNSAHYEIYSVDKVVGWEQGTSVERAYEPFYSFSRAMSQPHGDFLCYATRLVTSVIGRGTETYITFVSRQGEGALPPTETVAVQLTCTHRRLPEGLGVGDIHVPGSRSPEFVTFSNLTQVTGSTPPPMDQGLHWRLISHLTLSHLPMASAEALRGVLQLYNFQALYDRKAAAANQLRMDGIRTVRNRPADHLLQGAPVRGTDVLVEVEEDNFAGEGDILLFGNVLSEFFALLSTVNAFTRLTIRGVREGEVYKWPARLGRQTLL